MFEEAFLKVGERLGALQAKIVLALVIGLIALIAVAGAGVYVWLNPLLQCRQQSTLLFFGTAMQESGETRQIESADWQDFVDSAILPRLPDGFTILQGQGVYRAAGEGAAVRENTHILLVAHRSEAEIDARLTAIAEDYKSRFRQESVLRLDQCGAYKF